MWRLRAQSGCRQSHRRSAERRLRSYREPGTALCAPRPGAAACSPHNRAAAAPHSRRRAAAACGGAQPGARSVPACVLPSLVRWRRRQTLRASAQCPACRCESPRAATPPPQPSRVARYPRRIRRTRPHTTTSRTPIFLGLPPHCTMTGPAPHPAPQGILTPPCVRAAAADAQSDSPRCEAGRRQPRCGDHRRLHYRRLRCPQTRRPTRTLGRARSSRQAAADLGRAHPQAHPPDRSRCHPLQQHSCWVLIGVHN